MISIKLIYSYIFRCIYFIPWLVPSIGYALDTRKVPVLDLKHRGTVLFPKFTLADTMEQGRQLGDEVILLQHRPVKQIFLA